MGDVSEATLEQVTGKPWATWRQILWSVKAEEMSHKDIANELMETYDVAGWWAQHLTVRFEREIGRREVGQVADGTFQTSVSKMVEGTMDDAMAWWREKVQGVGEFRGVPVLETGESTTDKWRHWRARLDDGSRLIVSSWQKSQEKAELSLAHEKLTSQEAAGEWKQFWKTFMADEGASEADA